MQAVITVVGSDRVGILAKVCTVCAQLDVNVEEVTQSILRGTFAMIMIVDITKAAEKFETLAASLAKAGEELEVDINITRQEIYDAMHRI